MSTTVPFEAKQLWRVLSHVQSESTRVYIFTQLGPSIVSQTSVDDLVELLRNFGKEENRALVLEMLGTFQKMPKTDDPRALAKVQRLLQTKALQDTCRRLMAIQPEQKAEA